MLGGPGRILQPEGGHFLGLLNDTVGQGGLLAGQFLPCVPFFLEMLDAFPVVLAGCAAFRDPFFVVFKVNDLVELVELAVDGVQQAEGIRQQLRVAARQRLPGVSLEHVAGANGIQKITDAAHVRFQLVAVNAGGDLAQHGFRLSLQKQRTDGDKIGSGRESIEPFGLQRLGQLGALVGQRLEIKRGFFTCHRRFFQARQPDGTFSVRFGGRQKLFDLPELGADFRQKCRVVCVAIIMQARHHGKGVPFNVVGQGDFGDAFGGQYIRQPADSFQIDHPDDSQNQNDQHEQAKRQCHAGG